MTTLAELEDRIYFLNDKIREMVNSGLYPSQMKLILRYRSERDFAHQVHHELFKRQFDYCYESTFVGYCEICDVGATCLPKRSTRVKRQTQFYLG